MVQVSAFGLESARCLAGRASNASGSLLPLSHDRARVLATSSSFRLGPTRWLVVDSAVDEDALLRRFSDIAADVAALMPFGHGRVVLRLSGEPAAVVLSKGCAIDLHRRTFPENAFAQTLLDRVPVLLTRIGSADVFDLYVPRSYAMHVRECLLDAAAEFGIFTD
ncbi:MAG: sarcosine oxidase subunit gamma [Burkholderiaceae bacterium]